METYIYNITILLIGLIFASATKCLVDSEEKRSFLTRRSQCSACKKELNFLDLIPIVSYLFKRGRCSYCKSRIPFDIFLYEFFTLIVLIFYFIFNKYFIFLNLFYISILIYLIFIAIEDVKYLEVVDELFYIFLLFNIGLLIFNFHFFDIFEWSLLVVIYHILYFIARGSLGYGDIKVFCVLVLNLNFFEGIYLFAFTFLYAGFFALGILVFKKVKRGIKIPLVPFIALGYFSVLLIREGILW